MTYLSALKSLLYSDSTPKLGLSRITRLLEAIGHPQEKFKSIHVAGTNGKGSTCAFLSNLLEEQFDRVGLYTSPHLVCARERIQINSTLISEELFSEAEFVVANAADRVNEKPTFFERTTAMAFWAFAEQSVDFAAIEVGLGGRLDATNVINPKASVITRVALDHCGFLGDTIEEIAFEKAGIIKPGIPVITGWQVDAALNTIRAVAEQNASPLIEVTQQIEHDVSLLGGHQRQNAALAVGAIKAAGVVLSPSQVESALLGTHWPARLEFIQNNPPILLDGAHNANGMRSLVAFLLSKKGRFTTIAIIIGATEGHDFNAIADELQALRPHIRTFIVTKSKSPRAAAPETLVSRLSEIAPCHVTQDVASALKFAGAHALTVVTGSLYVAGEARSLFIEMPYDPELPIF